MIDLVCSFRLQNYCYRSNASHLEVDLLLAFLLCTLCWRQFCTNTVSSGESVLNFGAGPTIRAVISASAKFRKIVFAEYTEANKGELRKWIANSQDKFDWSKFFKYVAVLEGMRLGGYAMSTHVLPCFSHLVCLATLCMSSVVISERLFVYLHS